VMMVLPVRRSGIEHLSRREEVDVDHGRSDELASRIGERRTHNVVDGSVKALPVASPFPLPAHRL
jgi:hypothetical protein